MRRKRPEEAAPICNLPFEGNEAQHHGMMHDAGAIAHSYHHAVRKNRHVPDTTCGSLTTLPTGSQVGEPGCRCVEEGCDHRDPLPPSTLRLDSGLAIIWAGSCSTDAASPAAKRSGQFSFGWSADGWLPGWQCVPTAIVEVRVNDRRLILQKCGNQSAALPTSPLSSPPRPARRLWPMHIIACKIVANN